MSSKLKPVAGPDDLLLLLVQHWARDQHVFPTEDDRHDLATILLFQSYTGGRPAEFVHALKGKASEDPLGKAEEASMKKRCPGRGNKSDDGGENTSNNSEYDDDSDDGGDPEYSKDDTFDSNYVFDSDDDDDMVVDNDNLVDEEMGRDSGYSSEGSDMMAEDADGCGTAEIDCAERPMPPKGDTAELDEYGEAIRQWKALCYEDICLWIVKNPKKGERDVLAMEVFLRHHKGVDNKPKPTTFLFRENALPILCPISHLLTRAIRDDAILVDGYTSAEPFFSTNLRGQKMRAMKVHWKAEWLKRPVFCRSALTVNGWVKSKTEPMTYQTYAFYINRLGRDTGFEDKLTSYCFRRGTANALDGVAPDAVRDQVMRHDPFTGVFNGAYINHSVRFNVQDAFLESEITDDGLTRAFTHMSIRCNPGAPEGVPRELMERIFATDPDIVDLERRFKASHTDLKWEYKFINRAPKKRQQEHYDLQKRLINAKKSLETEINEMQRKDYFFQIHNEMMKKQLQRHLDKTSGKEDPEDVEDPEPVIEHQLRERTQLQQVLCDLSKSLSPQAVVTRKVLAINLMITLASRQEFQTRKPLSPPASKYPIKNESSPDPSPTPEEFPLACKKTQCIICIGNEQLSYEQRMRTFKRVSHMWDHVENVHLRHIPTNRPIICVHPVCKDQGVILSDIVLFKNHVERVHEIKLRPPRFFPS
ncbi:hypothetical protein B7463_g7279, partial [Scytalidium lignicola]